MSSDLPVHHPGGAPTVLGLSPADRLVLLIGGPVLGLVLGFLLPPLSKWISKAPLPLLGIFKLIASFHTGWVVVVCVVLGFLVGLGLSASALANALSVTVADDHLQLKRDEAVRTVPRSQVESVFADGRQLVVLDHESRQLVRDTPEAKPARMAQAFQAHAYPWASADPYAELYRRWEAASPDVPAAVGGLLAAREVALGRKAPADAARLLSEVEGLGFTVREDGTSQFWRPLVPS